MSILQQKKQKQKMVINELQYAIVVKEEEKLLMDMFGNIKIFAKKKKEV